jgi:hypothetical protein
MLLDFAAVATYSVHCRKYGRAHFSSTGSLRGFGVRPKGLLHRYFKLALFFRDLNPDGACMPL